MHGETTPLNQMTRRSSSSDHPDPDEDEAIELEIEGDVPDLASLPDDNTSVSSSESDNTSTTYYDLDDLVDNVVPLFAAYFSSRATKTATCAL